MHRQPHVHHLDDPVTEVMVLTRPIMSRVLTDLPRGKYIVCGEAMSGEGEEYQHNCFETRIVRAETDSECVNADNINTENINTEYTNTEYTYFESINTECIYTKYINTEYINRECINTEYINSE